MSSPEQHRRLQSLVEAALDQPAGERTQYLAKACSSEPDLLPEATSLLELYSDEDPTAEPERIGPYRLIRELGVGGMGIVYLAEREGGYHRKVAMKVIRRGMDTDFFLARFFKEREILGAMDHTGVVRIVDAGSTMDGRPYLVMDYVDGIRIDKFCEQNISITERLHIFIKVCSAVQHAHRNLIVHRDLKPGNILVTPDGEPKLLDFGIAKVVDENDERTQLTIPIMTRQYASPEQVKGKRITTSCDIYALGLILYEMLTGHRPYDLKDKPVDEVERLVCTIDPPPPSALMTESTSRTVLRGDLDRIVLMALRKEPERRYGSVEAMAADLTRYLDGRPVSAQRDTWHYRASKFIHRNRGGVALASIVAATILGGASGILWQANIARAERARGEHEAAEARVQRQKAEEARTQADARFEDVRALANSLIFDLHDSIRELPGSSEAQKILLSNAIKYTERLAKESGSDPKLQSDLAVAYERVGLLQSGSPGSSSSLGDTGSALASQQKALAIRQTLVTGYPANDGYKRDLASSYLRIAELEHILNRPAAELENARKAIAISGGQDPAGYQALATALTSTGDLNGALTAVHQEIVLRRRVENASPQDLNRQVDTREALEQEAAISEQQGRFDQALKIVRDNAPVFERAVDANPHNLRFHRLLVENQRRAANIEERTGDLAAARANYQKALDWQTHLVEQDPRNARLVETQVAQRLNLARTLERLGDYDTALAETRRAAASAEDLATHDPTNLRARSTAASAWREAGQILLSRHNYDEASAAFKKATAESGSSSDDALTRALSALGLGQIDRDQSRLPAAEIQFKNAIALLGSSPKDFRATGNLAVAHNRLGEVQLRSGHAKEALESFQTAALLAQRLLAIDSNNTWAATVEAESLSRQGEIHQSAGDFKQALAKYEASAQLDESVARRDPRDVQARRNSADSRYHVCLAQSQLEMNSEALTSCKAAITQWSALLNAKPPVAVHADLAYGLEKAGEIRLKVAQSSTDIEACRMFEESLSHWRQSGESNAASVRVEQRTRTCPLAASR